MKRYIYPLILICLSLFVLRGLLLPGFPETHDGQNHLARLANFATAIKDGHFPVRWSPNLNYKLGYPVFNFNYFLPQLLSLIPTAIGFTYQQSLKIVSIFSLTSAGLLWYFFLNQFYRKLSAFIAASFSISAIYPLVLLFVRGSIGESLAYSLIPLSLLFLYKLITKPTRLNFLASTLALFFLLINHNIMALFGLPFLFIYSLFLCSKPTNKKALKLVLVSFSLSIGLSLFFWLPALMEKQYTYLDRLDLSNRYFDHFINPIQLFKSNWDYGYSRPGLTDALSFELGPLHWLAIALSLAALLLKKPKKHQKVYHFFFISFITSIFLMLPVSNFLWQIIPFIHFIQFPWRLLLFTTSSSIFLIAFLSQKLPKLGFILAALAYAYASLTTSPHPSRFHWPNDHYYNFAATTSTDNENLPHWFERGKVLDLVELPNQVFNAQDIYKPIDYQVFDWQTNYHSYQVTVSQETQILERTMYFPGWHLLVNDQPTKINYQHPDRPGIISYALPAGTHQIETRFTENTPSRIIGDSISLASLAALLIFSFSPVFKRFS